MLHRLRNSMKKKRFYSQTKNILDTPPIRLVKAKLAIISMVSNADVQMYLLSMKSFYARIGRGRIIVIIDRDMPQSSRDILSRHFVGIEFAILEDIVTGACQRGGTWERLVFLLNHAQDEYAIQVDCDTLAFGGDLDEVLDCVASNRAFTLSAGGQPIRTMKEYAANARTLQAKYVGIRVEQAFDQYPGSDSVKYVRGSSGFAGFAAGGFSISQIETFHEEMRRRMGDDEWRIWGTEQNGSNFAVANSPDAVVLPYPKYANFNPDLQPGPHAFFHFFGTHRYDGNVFADKGRQVISELNGLSQVRGLEVAGNIP
jgi:hypothetical protein